MLSYQDAAAEVMEHLCSHSTHGYSQPNRQGVGTGANVFESIRLSDGSSVSIARGDRDCSSAAIECYAALGVDVGGATYTGNMRRCMTGTGNFRWIADLGQRRRGDILLNETHHAAVFLGNGKLGQFSISENGTVTGRRGDQTGYESNIKAYYDYPWNGILRYCGPARSGSAAPSVTVPPTQSTGGLDLGPDLIIWGPKFTRAMEEQLGSGVVDGVISGQSTADKTYFWATNGTVEYGSGGSRMVVALQNKLIKAGYSCGSKGADGCYGPSTIRAHQQWLITHGYGVGASGADGYNGHDTNKAVAAALAAGAYR